MPTVFTSHQFILALAQNYQVEYVHALYDYIDSKQIQNPAPFQMVHTKLATLLHEFPQLVWMVRDIAPSRNIFGDSQECSEWRRLN